MTVIQVQYSISFPSTFLVSDLIFLQIQVEKNRLIESCQIKSVSKVKISKKMRQIVVSQKKNSGKRERIKISKRILAILV